MPTSPCLPPGQILLGKITPGWLNQSGLGDVACRFPVELAEAQTQRLPQVRLSTHFVLEAPQPLVDGRCT